MRASSRCTARRRKWRTTSGARRRNGPSSSPIATSRSIDPHTEESMTMVRNFAAAGICAAWLAVPAFAQAQADLSLWRLDCGTAAKPTAIAERFTDTFAYPPDKLQPFTYSCYVIKHGADYMVWDTGFPPGANPNAPKVSLADQLAQIKVTPEQVKYVGISHFHADHTSQLPALTNATLFIGKGDWDGVT